MTQPPFHPDHHEDDALNTLLDALVSGKSAPEAGPASAYDTDAFAAAHRLVSGEYAAYASAAPSDDTLDAMWRTVMHIRITAPELAGGTPPMSTRQRARLSAVPERPHHSPFQTLVSMCAVAALLLVLIGAAWLGRGGNGAGPVEPEPNRYAARPLEQGTPVSDAFSVDPWMMPIDPSECTAEPMTSREYTDKVLRSPEPPQRSYDITGEADPASAQQAVSVARAYYACEEFARDVNRTRSLSTARLLLPSTTLWAAPDSDYPADWRTSPESEFIAYFSYALPPSAWNLIFDAGAPEYVQEVWESNVIAQSTPVVPLFGMEDENSRYFHDMPYGIPAYNPDQAMILADGRIAIPMTRMYWWDDPNLDNAADLFEPTSLRVIVILSDVEGEWLIDEWVYLCFGTCELPPMSPGATPVASPVARPAATPVE